MLLHYQHCSSARVSPGAEGLFYNHVIIIDSLHLGHCDVEVQRQHCSPFASRPGS